MRISKAHWSGVLWVLAACGSGSTLAQSAAQAPPEPVDGAKAEAPEPGAPKDGLRPFIERSLVIAPERVGKFRLEVMKDYPDQPGAGVQVRYEHEDFPNVRVDLFVYPAGRVDRAALMVSAMAELKASIQHAVDQGKYSGLVWGEETDFDLARVDEDGSMMPARVADAAAKEGGENARIVAEMHAARAREDYRLGRRLDARMNIGDEAMNSRGYLFYRGLFLVKGRVSAAPDLLPGEIFDRFTNHAMATLVPVVRARSTGECHKSTIYYDPEEAGAAVRLAGLMAAANLRSEDEQCAKVLDEAVPEGHRAMPLVFDPAMWGGKG